MKTTYSISSRQISCIHTLLAKKGIKESKEALVAIYTDGKKKHVSDMTGREAMGLITYLKGNEDEQRRRKKIFELAREIGLIYDYGHEANKINAAKIDSFLLRRGFVKKKLMDCSSKELSGIIRQLHACKRTYIKREINQLLDNSGINKI